MVHVDRLRGEHATASLKMPSHFFHGGWVLKRARRKFTRAVISGSDICGPRAGIDRPSAPVGGLMPFRITCTTLSGTGAWIELCNASGTVAPLLRWHCAQRVWKTFAPSVNSAGTGGASGL